MIIGAGPTGMAAAYHLGEHSLLLEQRDSLEDADDHSNDFPMGATRGGGVGHEDTVADGQRQGVSQAERKALYITCSAQGSGADKHTLIRVTRWQPPVFNAHEVPGATDEPSVRSLLPLVRGEIRFGAIVMRITPSMRLLELSNGDCIVFDKLISTLSLSSMARLVMHELPGRVRHDESLRYWLADHDIEIADRATREYYGDVDGFAAGKRVAEQIGGALSAKFRNAGHSKSRDRLFVPRLVHEAASPAGS